MSDIELKPCPFCGGEAVVHVNNGVRAICKECGASSKVLVDGYSQGRPNGSAIKGVVKAWNTRKPMERIVEQLERERLIAFETLANTGDKELDLSYKKVADYADIAISIEREKVRNE